MDLVDLLRPVLWIARALLWVGWDLLFRTVGWSVGWLFWRAITLGRFPDAGIKDVDETSFGHSLLVEFTGLALLAGLVVFLSIYVQGQ